jgi:hypothetical protein
MTITTTADSLPTSVIIEWALSGKAPAEWRVYPTKGTILYSFGNAVGATFIMCYPFAVGGTLYGIVQLILSHVVLSNTVVESLLTALTYAVIFISGIFLIVGVRLLFNAIQQFWRTKMKPPRPSSLRDQFQKAAWWFYLTYLAGIVGFIGFYPNDWLIAPVVTFCVCASLMGVIYFLFRAASQNDVLVLTGKGFVEGPSKLKRFDYLTIASLTLREDGKGFVMTDKAGKIRYWAPANKYDVTVADIIRDYEQYNAR